MPFSQFFQATDGVGQLHLAFAIAVMIERLRLKGALRTRGLVRPRIVCCRLIERPMEHAAPLSDLLWLSELSRCCDNSQRIKEIWARW